MLLPLGLGIKFKKHQWMTYGIILICISSYLLSPNTNLINERVSTIFAESSESKVVGKLYLEYCISRVTDRKKCLFSKPFFQLKRKKGEYERSKKPNFKTVLDDMGSAYQETPHYLKFYQKLFNDDSSVHVLPSFNEYRSVQKKFLEAASNIYRQNNLLSKNSNSVFVTMIAIFSSIGIIHLIWNIFILTIIGRYIEKRIGPTSYILLFFIVSIVILKFYVSTLSEDNIQFIVGSGVPISFFIGFFYIMFIALKLKVAVFKFGRPSYIFVSLKYIVPIIYLTQEVLMLLTSKNSLPHRAHFFSLTIGVVLAVIWKKMSKLQDGFLFPIEFKQWSWVRKQTNTQLFLNSAVNILEENTSNYVVREELVERIKLNIEAGDKVENYLNFLDIVLPIYLKEKFEEKVNINKIQELIFLLPPDKNLSNYLREVDEINVWNLIESTGKKNKPVLEIKLICAYCDLFPLKKRVEKLKVKMSEVVELNKNNEQIKTLLFQVSQTANSESLRDYVITILRSINISDSG